VKAVILSGGQGLRLRPLTEDKPKPLIEVAGKPIAEHQVDWLTSNASIDKLIFACGWRWERLREHFGTSHNGIPVEYSVESEPLGTGGAIRQALPRVGDTDENVIVLNGDIITDLPLRRMIEWHTQTAAATVTMLVVPYRSRFGIVHIDKLRTVRKFEEKPEFPDVWINGGIYVMNVKRVSKHLPEKGDIERETFPKLVPYGEICSFPHYGRWWYIDSMKDLKEVEVELNPGGGQAQSPAESS
jgi:mannose-1-phosphate guanylyltransferase